MDGTNGQTGGAENGPHAGATVVRDRGRNSKGLRHEVRLIGKRSRQVWKLVPRPHKVALGGAALLMALTSLVGTFIPIFLGALVDQLRTTTGPVADPEGVYRSAVWFLGLIGGAYLLREAVNLLRRWLVENTCTRLERDVTVRLVSHLMKAELGAASQEKVGALHGRISRSVDGYVRFVRLSFLTFFPALLTGLFAVATVWWKQPWVGVVMLGVIPTSILLTVWQLLSQRGVRLKLLRLREEMDGTLVEQLGGLDYVRAANTHKLEVKRVARSAERRRAREIRHHVQMGLFGCAKALNEGLFHILVLALAIYLAVQGAVTFGDVVVFSMLFLNVMAPLAEIHRVIDEGHECSLQVGDLLDLLHQPVDCSFATPDSKPPQFRRGELLIEVDGLCVEYAAAANGGPKQALRGVSMAIRHGAVVGIAGRSGGGKSTWLKVLMRLTHPCAGRFLVGGVPLEEMSREAIGRLIGYVGQAPFLFSGTVGENIAYGTAAAPEQIEDAARRACIHDEILALPGGYAAPVAERGQNLSGGQRQRIALARVFLKEPPILILDEGTSALDNISERHVQRALAAWRADRTMILVAHRLTTLLDADHILVFDDGRIVEQGSYSDLIGRDGVFAELARCANEANLSQGMATRAKNGSARESVSVGQ